MWPLLTIFAIAAAVGIYIFSQKKFSRLQRKMEVEMEDFQRHQQQTTTDAKAQQQVLFNSMLEGCCCWIAAGKFISPTAPSKTFSESKLKCAARLLWKFCACTNWRS